MFQNLRRSSVPQTNRCTDQTPIFAPKSWEEFFAWWGGFSGSVAWFFIVMILAAARPEQEVPATPPVKDKVSTAQMFLAPEPTEPLQRIDEPTE